MLAKTKRRDDPRKLRSNRSAVGDHFDLWFRFLALASLFAGPRLSIDLLELKAWLIDSTPRLFNFFRGSLCCALLGIRSNNNILGNSNDRAAAMIMLRRIAMQSINNRVKSVEEVATIRSCLSSKAKMSIWSQSPTSPLIPRLNRPAAKNKHAKQKIIDRSRGKSIRFPRSRGASNDLRQRNRTPPRITAIIIGVPLHKFTI